MDDRRNSYISMTPSSCPSSANGSFDSAYSYPAHDRYMLATPTSDRRSSCASFEYRSGQSSTLPGTPLGTPHDADVHDPFNGIASVTQAMLPESMFMSTTPCKSYHEQSIMDYDPYVDSMYNQSFPNHNVRAHITQYHAISPASSMTMYSSPTHDFVVPSQTFNDDMYAMPSPHSQLGMPFDSSPYSNSSHHMSPLRDFITPSPPRHRGDSWGSSSARRSLSPAAYERTAAIRNLGGLGGFGGYDAVKSGRIRKSSKKTSRECGIIEKGQFPCTYPGCKSRPFKRQEHLKRHSNTHGNSREYPCKYCSKVFNRTDNLRQHTTLHAVLPSEKKSSRTEYFPEAAKEIEIEARLQRKLKTEQE